MDEHRNESGPQGAGEPYGGGAPDGGSGFYLGLEDLPDHVVYWDPTLPLRQNPSCYGAVGRGKDDSVRTSRQSTGSELSFPGTEWAFIEKPVDLVLEFTVDEAAFHVGQPTAPRRIEFFDPTLALRMSEQTGAVSPSGRSESGTEASSDSEGGSHA